MLTDGPPLDRALQEAFRQSDRLTTLELPPDNRLRMPAISLEAAMKSEQRAAVSDACAGFLSAAAAFYRVGVPRIRVLAARPLRVREGGWATELFVDYAPETKLIRVWMRTSIRKQVTSFGTLLSTLCHEFCHHLDCQRFGFRDTPHTRGFYERTASLYHHSRGTPLKRLVWAPLPGGRWRIDWPRTNRGN